MDKNNVFDMLKNFQGQFGDMQEKLATQFVTGESGGGLVKITINGKMEITEVKIDPQCVDSRDIPMLEDLVKSAFTSAGNKMKEKLGSEFGSMIPGGGGFPFNPGSV